MHRMLLILSFLLSQEIADGMILFTPYNSQDSINVTYLTDHHFNEINTWEHEQNLVPASMPYLNQDSTIWYPCKSSNPTMVSGGVGGLIQKLDWNNDIVWEFSISNDSLQHHHDIEPMPNGNILIIAWSRKNLHDAQSMGREIIETPLQQMWSESIFEIKPIGSDSAEIVWEWHLWDHLVQDVNPNLSNYGVISEHPELLNINLGQVGFGMSSFGSDNADWIHFNSIDYNPYLDQIVLSSRMMNEIYIIDHSTTTQEAASHSGGNSGKGGDFLYRWGNPQNYDRGTDADRILGSQHSVSWIDADYPGEGNLLIFNNLQFGNNSAVIEISTPNDFDGNYALNNLEPYAPESWNWMFYNPSILMPQIIQSGAHRLENGNTFITTFSNAKMIEISMDGDILLEYSPPQNYVINRAHKYADDYLAPTIGDINNDNFTDILDIILLIEIIIEEEAYNLSADINSDQIIDILDIISLLNRILS
ncbi:MAG: hypothetical protein CMG11_01710 [Candidatus Marinimicrobia bacterium]|nr:hypothetical protein [Candidatus Neomarinimicrobiota bacterium]|tara:strand:+ start:1975 stop:3405 length:1431 start_codon:yes stop_codon:yes gene_type:complete